MRKTRPPEEGAKRRHFAHVAAIGVGALMAITLASANSAQAWTLKTLHSFCAEHKCHDGLGPLGRIMIDQSGNLYGTAADGGPHHGKGVVYELARRHDGTWKYKLLYGFCKYHDCSDGSVPNGGVFADTERNLYGTTISGGSHDRGTAFVLTPNADRSTWTVHTLYTFCSKDNCSDGLNPSGPLTYMGAATGAAYDGISPLYGTTSFTFSVPSTVFELTRGENGWNEAVIATFAVNAAAGFGVVADASGNLYGVSNVDGAYNQGTIFELSLNAGSWTKTVLYDFCKLPGCADGGTPSGPLLMDASGDLYGTVAEGGTGTACGSGVGCGGVFKLVPKGNQSQYTLLYSFCLTDCADGRYPKGGVTMDEAGNLFGTTEGDGVSGLGTVFELSGTHLQTLYTFCAEPPNCTDGEYPEFGVALDASGNLIGTTSFDAGTIFELSP